MRVLVQFDDKWGRNDLILFEKDALGLLGEGTVGLGEDDDYVCAALR